MPQCPTVSIEPVRLWRDTRGTGPTEYYQDPGQNVCLNCPASEAACLTMAEAPANIRRFSQPPDCPLALAIYHGLGIADAEKLAGVLDPDNPLSLKWYSRAIRQMGDRENFMKTIGKRKRRKYARPNNKQVQPGV